MVPEHQRRVARSTTLPGGERVSAPVQGEQGQVFPKEKVFPSPGCRQKCDLQPSLPALAGALLPAWAMLGIASQARTGLLGEILQKINGDDVKTRKAERKSVGSIQG